MRSRKMWKSILLLMCLSGYCYAGPLNSKRNMPIIQREDDSVNTETVIVAAEEPAAGDEQPVVPASALSMPSTMTLPSNATSIRADITDGFSCKNREYGYYADVENECQIFHVCLPVTYADGKENTFRWSFICPEETIFSQDSFTCMRREDMTIDCEESVKYYELNRNFGMTNEDKNMNSNNAASSNHEDQESLITAQAEQQQEQQQQQQVQPQQVQAAQVHQPLHDQQPNEEPAQASSVPVPAITQPVKQQEKPVKKPNRRKPAHSAHLHNKLPINSPLPLRKMPQLAATAVPEATTIQPLEVIQNADEVKPAPVRFTKRPAATTATSIKEKLQLNKIETSPNRIDLYKRKRPTSTNKKDAVIAKPAEEPAIITDVSEPSSSVPATTVELQSNTNIVASFPKPEINKTEQPADKVESHAPNSETATSEADTEPQASETSEIVVKPEPVSAMIVKPLKRRRPTPVVKPNADIKDTAPEKIKAEEPEAIKESPILAEEQTVNVAASNAQSETIAVNKPTVEETLKVEEPLETKPSTAEESTTAEESDVTKTQIPEETLKIEEPHVPIEAFEEIPAVIAEVEEIKPDASADSTEEKASATIVENKPAGVTSDEVKPSAQEAQPIAAVAAPAIFEENSEEVSVVSPSLEEMEDAKPADALEFLPATPEMEHHDPVVQEMFGKQPTGGFKPVDPVLAAEAEALITDFLNTLRTDNSNVNHIMPNDMAEIHEPAIFENQSDESVDAGENGEALKTITKTESEATDVKESEEAKAEESKENLEIAVPSPQGQSFPSLSNSMMMSSFPAEMFQIPVKIIETPTEELQSSDNNKDEEKKETESEQPKPVEPEIPTSNFGPLSIDDIVELVKERLDQVPTTEKGMPMELILEEQSQQLPSEDNPANEQVSAEEKPAAIQSQEEEIVKPIYQRVGQVNANMVKTPNLMANEPASIEINNNGMVDEEQTNVKTLADKPTQNTLTVEKSVQTEDITSQALKTDSETDAKPESAPATDAAIVKGNRAYRSRSLSNSAKMDPRKRRFLFRSDAS